ncbi:MAG: cytochrome c oxidase subunit [Acidimicrobiales bacterium]|nr:cytochrome c oxidase subunit [Acidimicrobiales bacterium]
MTKSPRLRRAGQVVLGLALTLIVAGCASNAPQDTLKPEGKYARQIDNLFKPVFLIAVVVFILVEGLVLFSVLKYRRRSDDLDEPADFPEQIHGSTKLEIGWTILPAVVLGLVAIVTIPVIFTLNSHPKGSMDITVTGQKYWWAYDYPTQPDVGITKAITTANELHIPAGKTVYLSLKSKDVIHSFWAPRLNGKRDVVPGRVHTWLLQADKPGVYSGQCAEFCGTSHANMRLKVVAHDPASWDKWVATMEAPLTKPTSGLAAEGYTLFQQKGCSGCHKVDGQWDEVAAGNPSAPNLTKLFTRDCFAGCIYNLDDRNELEAWLRNPQRKAGSLMKIGQLSEDEIDRLYAYLQTLK